MSLLQTWPTPKSLLLPYRLAFPNQLPVCPSNHSLPPRRPKGLHQVRFHSPACSVCTAPWLQSQLPLLLCPWSTFLHHSINPASLRDVGSLCRLTPSIQNNYIITKVSYSYRIFFSFSFQINNSLSCSCNSLIYLDHKRQKQALLFYYPYYR